MKKLNKKRIISTKVFWENGEPLPQGEVTFTKTLTINDEDEGEKEVIEEITTPWDSAELLDFGGKKVTVVQAVINEADAADAAKWRKHVEKLKARKAK